MAAANCPVAATVVSNAAAKMTRSGPIIIKTVRTRNRAAESKATSPRGDAVPMANPPSDFARLYPPTQSLKFRPPRLALATGKDLSAPCWPTTFEIPTLTTDLPPAAIRRGCKKCEAQLGCGRAKDNLRSAPSPTYVAKP
jgi:hypothetical protein